MKKCIPIVFIGLILTSASGYYMYFFVRQISIWITKSEQLRATPKAELQTIIMLATKYRDCLVGEDEIKVDHRMFDVAFVESKGDSVVVYGLFDAGEDELVDVLESLTSHEHQGIVAVHVSDLFNWVYLPSFVISINDLYHVKLQGCTTCLVAFMDHFASSIFLPPEQESSDPLI